MRSRISTRSMKTIEPVNCGSGAISKVKLNVKTKKSYLKELAPFLVVPEKDVLALSKEVVKKRKFDKNEINNDVKCTKVKQNLKKRKAYLKKIASFLTVPEKIVLKEKPFNEEEAMKVITEVLGDCVEQIEIDHAIEKTNILIMEERIKDQKNYTAMMASKWLCSTEQILDYVRWMQTFPWGNYAAAGTLIKNVGEWASMIIKVQEDFTNCLCEQLAKDRALMVKDDHTFWLRSKSYEILFDSGFRSIAVGVKNLNNLATALSCKDLVKQNSLLEQLKELIQTPTVETPQFPEPFKDPCVVKYEYLKEIVIKDQLLRCAKTLFLTNDLNQIAIPRLKESMGKNEVFFLLSSFYNALCEMSPYYQKALRNVYVKYPGYINGFQWLIIQWTLRIKYVIKKQFIPAFKSRK